MQTESVAKQNGAARGAEKGTKPIKVPITLHPDQKGEIKVSGNGGLKDFTIVAMVNGSGDLTQMTICRPIGRVPNTDDNDYVMIPSDHIKSYVLAAGIESQVTKNSELILARAKDAFLVSRNLYRKEGDVLMWGDQTVSAVWREASVLRTNADKLAKEAYYAAEAEQGRYLPGKPQNPGKGVPAKTCKPYTSQVEPVESFLPKEKLEPFKSSMEAWKMSPEKKAAERAKQDLLMTEPTLGGPNGITPQTVLTWLKGCPHPLVKQYVIRSLSDPAGVAQEITTKFRGDPLPP